MNIISVTTVLVIAILTVIAGCATDHTTTEGSQDVSQEYINNTIDPAIREAAQALVDGNAEHANELLNVLLSRAPRDPLANLLNGIAYQERSIGEGPYWDMAKVGYQLAKKFDPYLWQASYLLGLTMLKERSLTAATVAFSESALASPHNPLPLYALAATSYVRGDLAVAYGAMRQALHFTKNEPIPGNYHIAALCAAAVGEFGEAATYVAALKSAGAAPFEIKWIEQKIQDWQEFHANLDKQQLINTSPQQATTSGSGTGSSNSTPHMAILDAIILRTSAVDTQSRGINLLEGLSAQFEGLLINPSRTRVEDFLADRVTSDTQTLTSSLKLSIPAVTYTLNIANSNEVTSRMVGHPSVIALDGQESKFFIGSELTIFTTGDFVNTAVKEFGLSIQVTPTFLPDGSVKLQVGSGLSALNSGKPPGIDKNSLSLEKVTDTVSAIMQFGETLVVSAGTIYQDSHQNTGVPILRSIPIINNIFSHQESQVLQGTLLILLTLKPSPDRDTPALAASELFKQNTSFLKVQQQFAPFSEGTQARLDKLKQHDLFAVIRFTDAAPLSPINDAGQSESLQKWRQRFLNGLITTW